ncbi:MAG: hypothetical protein M3320_01985 [Actinomycetota bacterium]|nr:hypothetical protein [Actinomycetota bacterium]MDQ5807423.1 hypothetical protein [Actinomycetota bacterium]
MSTAAREEALRLVREGWALHYEGDAPDPDLALLDGDRLYAAGLEKLAGTGDLEAIAALADLISDCARAAAEERPDATAAAWRDTARSLGVTRFTAS